MSGDSAGPHSACFVTDDALVAMDTRFEHNTEHGESIPCKAMEPADGHSNT